MRFITTIFLASLAIAASFAPASAQLGAGEVAYSEKPLLVIRYNQPRVYFDTALDQAVAAANRAKADVRYNVVAYVPDSVDQQTTRARLREVVGRIMADGVSASRITWKTEPTTGGYQEIHLYVE